MGKDIKEDKKHRFKRPKGFWLWMVLVLAVVAAAGVVYYTNHNVSSKVGEILPNLTGVGKKPAGGKIVTQEVLRNYSIEEVNALAKQNYGNEAPPARNPITKRLIKYTSVDPSGQQIEVYARVYLPRTSAGGKIPVISFAPGTTGVGDSCAASLEEPFRANWANYESHMAAYAGQGYAIVITDYEGMRDASRIHHYMVGELEGRAVLDAARAVYNLSDFKNLNRDELFLAGYSQGGHAAGWADRIASSYAPDLKIKGVIGFAPVSDVGITLMDITRGANIVWFGPFILDSYADYYQKNFDLSKILLPRWIPTLKADVESHCINSVKYWPKAEEVYTPEFLAAMRDNTLAQNYPDLAETMSKNEPWDQPTATPKLINQGDKDNIIIPDQQTRVLPKLCQAGSGPVQLQKYPNASHYTVMVQSFKNTLAWMAKAAAGEALPSSCSTTTGGV